MPATVYLEEALLKVLNGESLEASLGTTEGVTCKKLYVGLAKKGGKKLGTISEVEECAWTSYARTLFTLTNTVTAGGEGEASEPSEIKNKSAIAIPIPTGAVTQGIAEYVFWTPASSGVGKIWYYAKLSAKATIENGTTTSIEFLTNELKVTVL